VVECVDLFPMPDEARRDAEARFRELDAELARRGDRTG
jgi:hypothetical protein